MVPARWLQLRRKKSSYSGAAFGAVTDAGLTGPGIPSRLGEHFERTREKNEIRPHADRIEHWDSETKGQLALFQNTHGFCQSLPRLPSRPRKTDGHDEPAFRKARSPTFVALIIRAGDSGEMFHHIMLLISVCCPLSWPLSCVSSVFLASEGTRPARTDKSPFPCVFAEWESVLATLSH